MKHIDDISDKAAFDNAIGSPVRPIGRWDMPTDKGTDKNGNVIPMTSWDKTRWLQDHEPELRARAAEIAVKMETGKWPGWEKGHKKGRPYERNEIVETMGFRRQSEPLLFMREPEFTRFIEWERYKHELNLRMSFSDMRPAVGVTATVLMIETVNRALLKPQSFKNAELLDATRKYIELYGRMQEGAQKPKNPRETLILFVQNMNLLPESARQRALGLFQSEMDQINAFVDGLADAGGDPGGGEPTALPPPEDTAKDDEDPPEISFTPPRPRSPGGFRQTHHASGRVARHIPLEHDTPERDDE